MENPLWTLEELETLYHLPLMELISKAHHIHCAHHNPSEIQVCKLISIKTGGCSEDCKYCAQSSRYSTFVSAKPVMKIDEVLEQAKKAIKQGATRICLGAAWREVREGKFFDEILFMIKSLAEMGVEVCCTLGLLNEKQAQKLKEAGLYAYNHNLDTSERYYPSIITTRTYQDRLRTLEVVEKAHLSVCCGGIIGMGEEIKDRLELLLTLSRRSPQPESVPINRLSKVVGTPLENLPEVSPWETLRMVAITRILMPKTMVRLSCGRKDLSTAEQALCFLAGANSIFSGEKLLTVENASLDDDEKLFQLLGLKKRPAYKEREIS